MRFQREQIMQILPAEDEVGSFHIGEKKNEKRWDISRGSCHPTGMMMLKYSVLEYRVENKPIKLMGLHCFSSSSYIVILWRRHTLPIFVPTVHERWNDKWKCMQYDSSNGRYEAFVKGLKVPLEAASATTAVAAFLRLLVAH